MSISNLPGWDGKKTFWEENGIEWMGNCLGVAFLLMVGTGILVMVVESVQMFLGLLP